MVDYFFDVRRDDWLRFLKRLKGAGDVDTDVLHPLQILLLDRRLAKDTIELGGVVEGLTCVEEWERFGVDRLACCEDGDVEYIEEERYWGFWGYEVFDAAERTFVVGGEGEPVDGEADFGW